MTDIMEEYAASLEDENDQLRAENERLKLELESYAYHMQENVRLRAALANQRFDVHGSYAADHNFD